MQDKLQLLFKCYNLLMMRILNVILVLNLAYEYETF